jgi:hypothetical protein
MCRIKDLVGRSLAGSLVGDNPFCEEEARLRKICCAKADTQRLSRSVIVTGSAQGPDDEA